MRETLRGFAAAVLARAREGGHLGRVRQELPLLSQAVLSNQGLFDVFTDTGIPVENRQAIAQDLLRSADPATVRLVSEAVALEAPGELPPALEWLVERAAAEQETAESGQVGPPAEPSGSRGAARDRIDGFARATLGEMADREDIDEVEDELFRFARTVEGSEPLQAVLTAEDQPVPLRQGVVADLLAGKASPATVQLVMYTLAAARARALVELLDWLVGRVAAERGLRVADVRAAAPLDDEQRRRLAEALGRMTGRQVKLRETVDPSLIGGLRIVVGDSVIDGTVRHRLDQLRAGLSAPSGASTPREPAADVAGGMAGTRPGIPPSGGRSSRSPGGPGEAGADPAQPSEDD